MPLLYAVGGVFKKVNKNHSSSGASHPIRDIKWAEDYHVREKKRISVCQLRAGTDAGML